METNHVSFYLLKGCEKKTYNCSEKWILTNGPFEKTKAPTCHIMIKYEFGDQTMKFKPNLS